MRRILRTVGQRIGREPVLLGSALVGVVALGVDVPVEVESALGVLVVWIVRRSVTPASNPRLTPAQRAEVVQEDGGGVAG